MVGVISDSNAASHLQIKQHAGNARHWPPPARPIRALHTGYRVRIRAEDSCCGAGELCCSMAARLHHDPAAKKAACDTQSWTRCWIRILMIVNSL